MTAGHTAGLKTFSVKIGDHEPVIFSARSRSAAVYQAFLAYSEAWDIRFGTFVRMASARSCQVSKADDGYDYVRRSYGLDVEIGQRVRLRNEGLSSGLEGVVIYPGRSTAHIRVLLNGRDHASHVHPDSIEILTASPTAPERAGHGQGRDGRGVR